MKSALQLFAKAGDGVFAVDQEQCILFWNDHTEQMLGYPTNEAVGKYCWELLNGKNLDGAQICQPNCPIFQKLHQNQPVEPFDLVVKTRSNRSIILNMSSIGLPENGENIIGLVHIQRKP